MAKEKKLRVRKHAVVLNRSAGGDASIFFFLTIMGIFMFIPNFSCTIFTSAGFFLMPLPEPTRLVYLMPLPSNIP